MRVVPIDHQVSMLNSNGGAGKFCAVSNAESLRQRLLIHRPCGSNSFVARPYPFGRKLMVPTCMKTDDSERIRQMLEVNGNRAAPDPQSAACLLESDGRYIELSLLA